MSGFMSHDVGLCNEKERFHRQVSAPPTQKLEQTHFKQFTVLVSWAPRGLNSTMIFW